MEIEDSLYSFINVTMSVAEVVASDAPRVLVLTGQVDPAKLEKKDSSISSESGDLPDSGEHSGASRGRERSELIF